MKLHYSNKVKLCSRAPGWSDSQSEGGSRGTAQLEQHRLNTVVAHIQWQSPVSLRLCLPGFILVAAASSFPSAWATLSLVLILMRGALSLRMCPGTCTRELSMVADKATGSCFQHWGARTTAPLFSLVLWHLAAAAIKMASCLPGPIWSGHMHVAYMQTDGPREMDSAFQLELKHAKELMKNLVATKLVPPRY